MITHEGGTIPEENLTNYNVDRVKTLGEAVLGLTLGCCPMPRPQVRSAHPARLLPDVRLLQHAQRRRARRRRRHQSATDIRSQDRVAHRRRSRACATNRRSAQAIGAPRRGRRRRLGRSSSDASLLCAAKTSSSTPSSCSKSARRTPAPASTSTRQASCIITSCGRGAVGLRRLDALAANSIDRSPALRDRVSSRCQRARRRLGLRPLFAASAGRVGQNQQVA